MHECAAQNETTKCITCYEAKDPEFRPSRGWGIDTEDEIIPINFCPYCGERLALIGEKVEVNRGYLQNWVDILESAKMLPGADTAVGRVQVLIAEDVAGRIRAVLDG